MAPIDLDPQIVRRFYETSVPTVVDILDYEFGLRTAMVRPSSPSPGLALPGAP